MVYRAGRDGFCRGPPGNSQLGGWLFDKCSPRYAEHGGVRFGNPETDDADRDRPHVHVGDGWTSTTARARDTATFT